MNRRAIAFLSTVGCIGALSTTAQAADKTSPVQVTWIQRIPMRDGVKLAATVFRDPKQSQPVPAIVLWTPYVGDTNGGVKQGQYFAQNGYAFVIVDLRGRGNSDGVFVPGNVEAKDGYDTIEWIAKQPWC